METVGCTLTLNACRRVTENGREYVVAPMTLLVEGVLAGSRGALFYPRQEIETTAGAWEGVAITRGHPVDATTNENVSVADLTEEGRAGVELGVVKSPRYEGDRLHAEGWFDVERAGRIDPNLLAQIEAGRPVELSTGLHTTNEPTRDSHNGRPYDAVARAYKPDHLAVLGDVPGACSVKDGCGVNNERTMAMPSEDLDISPEKACQILKDGEANGQPLTESQRGMFGAKCGESKTTNQGNPMSREANVKLLTANCACWKGKEKLLANAAEFSDADIDALVANLRGAATATVLRKKFGLTVNAEAEPDMDEAEYAGLSEEEKKKKREAMLKMLAEHDTGTIGSAHKVGAALDKHTEGVTGNQTMTFTQRLEREGTPEEKAVWNAAVAAEYEQRAGMARQMVANVAQAERDKEFADLMKLPPNQFRDLYTRWQKYTPTGNQQTVAQPGQPLYVGNAGGPWGYPTQPQGPAVPTLDLAALRREYAKQS